MFLEVFGELLLELFGEAVLDLALRALGSLFRTAEFKTPAGAASSYFVFGALTGGFSLFIFPHPLVHASRLHGVSLFVSPIATGSVMWLIGSVLRRKGKRAVQLETFWYGFAFAFGMALVRFLLAA